MKHEPRREKWYASTIRFNIRSARTEFRRFISGVGNLVWSNCIDEYEILANLVERLRVLKWTD